MDMQSMTLAMVVAPAATILFNIGFPGINF
jgi:hypothetical protein